MNIYPEMQIKKLHECSSGDLVRQQHSQGGFSIVAGEGEDRTLIELANAPGFPRYILPPKGLSAKQPMVWYGQSYSIEVSQDDVEFGAFDLAEVPGVLWLTDVGLLMMTGPPGVQFGKSFYAVKSRQFVEEPSYHGTARFPRWTLFLTSADPQKPIKLLNFEAKKK